MKKTLFTSILILIGTIVFIESCENDDNKAVNPLCDGNSKNTFMPLDSANNWKYDYSKSQTIGGNIRVIDHYIFNDKTYAVLKDQSDLMYINEVYLREDADNHNIYSWSESKGMDYLLVPANPQLNQTWESATGFTKKVTNTAATKKTTYCTYTGILEITEYYGTTEWAIYYYKKGLGLVYKIEKGFSTSTYELYFVTLK
jgi:hypothetical protein